MKSDDFRNRDDVLADILADHEVALSQRVGAAYDATARAGPVTRLAALVEAFYRFVLAAADAHRAMLFSTALLPAEPQAWVKARYRALLDSFAETLGGLPRRCRPARSRTSWCRPWSGC